MMILYQGIVSLSHIVFISYCSTFLQHITIVYYMNCYPFNCKNLPYRGSNQIATKIDVDINLSDSVVNNHKNIISINNIHTFIRIFMQ